IPEKWAYLIAHNTVQDASRLLRIHDVLIDQPGIGNSGLDGLWRNLIKENAENIRLFAFEYFLQVLADGFAFAIRVGRQEDSVRGFRGCAKFLNDFVLAR